MPWNGLGRSSLPISGGGGASSGGGGGVTQWVEQQIYYVGKHGVDTNDGTSINIPFLTIGAAITAAAAAPVPSTTNRYAIVVLDDGVYTENVTCQSWINIYAPNAKLAGTLALADDVTVEFEEIEVGNALVAVTHPVGETGTARIKCNEIIVGDGSTALLPLALAGSLIAEVQTIRLGSVSFGVGDVISPIGYIDVVIEDIYLSGVGALGVGRAANGTTNGRIGRILESGAGVGTGTGITLTAGTANLFVGDISATTAYGAFPGSTLNMFVGSVTGLTLPLGTMNVVLSSDAALLGGRAAGQTLNGGNTPATDLTLYSTSDPIKGDISIPAGERVLFGNSDTRPPLNVTERNAPPVGNVAVGDIYLDDGTTWGVAAGVPGWRRCVSLLPTVWKDVGFVAGGAATWTENDTIYVDGVNGNDANSGQDPANPLATIGQAITNAGGGTAPAVANQKVIRIAPGVYSEAVATANDYVHFIGTEEGAVRITQSGVNTFTVSNDNVHLRNLHIIQTTNGTNALLSGGAATGIEVDNCHIEQTAASITLATGTPVDIGHAGTWEFRACYFNASGDADGSSFYASGAAGTIINMWDCRTTGWTYIDDGDFYAVGCTFYTVFSGYAAGAIYSNAGAGKYFVLQSCRAINSLGSGVRITAATIWSVLGCDIQVGSGGYDTSVYPTSNTYPGTVKGTRMNRGMGGETVLNDGIYNFLSGPANASDYFEDSTWSTFHTGRPSGEKYVVEVLGDLTLPGAVTYFRYGTTAFIRGNGHTIDLNFRFSLSDTKVIFDHVRFISGSIWHYFQMSDPDSRLEFDSCYFDDGTRVLIDNVAWVSGKLVMKNCIGEAYTGAPLIECNDTEVEIVLENCDLMGSDTAPGYPVIDFSVANSNLWATNCLLRHGGGDGNDAIESSAAMNVYLTQCRSHTGTDGATFDNDTGGGQITDQIASGHVFDANLANMPDASVL